MKHSLRSAAKNADLDLKRASFFTHDCQLDQIKRLGKVTLTFSDLPK